MPIKIPDNLPARDILVQEEVPIITESTAIKQDIRPLRILLLNLMPDKITTETQIARVLGATPLQIELTLLRTKSYMGKNTPEEHQLGFYKTHDEIIDECFDGMIVTGAPVGQMKFEDVEYWDELQRIFDWSSRHAFHSFHICWGALAGLYHFHNLTKIIMPQKQFGVYPHKRMCLNHYLTKGFDDVVNVPVSRYTRVDDAEVLANTSLTPLLISDDIGIGLIADDQNRRIFMLNHLEYDRETLGNEYMRDINGGIQIDVPKNYFPNNDPSVTPVMTWRAHRNLLFANWINRVYQDTPYDVNEIKKMA